MKAKNVTLADLQAALATVNERYDGNVQFRDESGHWNSQDRYNGGPRPSGTRVIWWDFRLRTRDYDRPGYRVAPSGRRMPSACWHVHGHFFDALLALCPDAVIKSGQETITADGGNWTDWEVGSEWSPLPASMACECSHGSIDSLYGSDSVYGAAFRGRDGVRRVRPGGSV